jgi:tetratricopeptide (TPR) repeat protein
VIAGIIGLAAIGFFVVKPMIEDHMLASNPIPVAVITFENQTGDRTYDYLQEAIPNLLITNLEQSHFLRVATWERLRDLMKQIGKEKEKTITSELGIELCRRGGINVIVVGRYTKAGEMFATDVKVLDVDTKELLKGANSKGRGIESILESQIDDLSEEIAQGAGLSQRRVEKAQLNIASVTTSSMDALNYFLRGRENYDQFYFQDAKKYLGKAIALDSSFAEAYVVLAFALAQLNENDSSDLAYKKAMACAPRSNERTRLKIEAAYAAKIEHDRAKSRRLLQEVIAKYPLEKETYYLLGILYRYDGAYELDVAEQKKALELDPMYTLALNELGYAYTWLGQYANAIESFQRQIAARPGDANPLDSMAELYFIMGNLDAAVARYEEVIEIKPDFFSSYMALSYILALRGELEGAQKSVDRFLTVVSSAGLKAAGLWVRALYDIGRGQYRQAFADLRNSRSFASLAKSQEWIAKGSELEGWIWFELSDYARGRAAMEQYYNAVFAGLASVAPDLIARKECTFGLFDLRQRSVNRARERLCVVDSLMPQITEKTRQTITYNRDILYAEILLAQDSAEKAVHVCADAGYPPVPSFDFTESVYYNLPPVRDTRARALLRLGDRNRGISDYERLVRFDSASGDRRIPFPRYRVDLARLYEKSGDYAKTMEQYERFLEAWKNADKGLPEIAEVKEAKRRLAGLKGKR